MIKRGPVLICRLVAVLVLACASSALAQTPSAAYPAKTVRVIVGFAAGGGASTAARVIAQKLGEALGQQFLIDNRPGAGSNVGAGLAAKAAPDGYTIFLGSVLRR